MQQEKQNISTFYNKIWANFLLILYIEIFCHLSYNIYMEEKISLNIKNRYGQFKEFRTRGSFSIDSYGNMMPKTRNKAIWGSYPYKNLPEQIKDNPNIIIPTSSHKYEDGAPVLVSSFFKFQRSKYNVLAESLGPDIACFFGSKTSYNSPAVLNVKKTVPEQTLSLIKPEQINSYGTFVVSMLGKEDRLYSLAFLRKKEEANASVKENLATIKYFVKEKSLEGNTPKIESQFGSIEKDFTYYF